MFTSGSRTRRIDKRAPKQVRIPLLIGSTLDEAGREASYSGIRLVVFGDGEYVVRQDPMAELWTSDPTVNVWLDGAPEIPQQRR